MMLFPRGKGSELFDFSLWEVLREGEIRVQTVDPDCGYRISCSLGLQPSRRELTPVRLCSVRLSWRQRARPSTTLHEIQICRSRLEYYLCSIAGLLLQVHGEEKWIFAG